MEDIRMSLLQTPFRYDYVGSFLRPERLKKARADFESGMINPSQLKEVEDECILDLDQQDQRSGISRNYRW